MGRILVEQGRQPEALVTYERVLEIDPSNADAPAAVPVPATALFSEDAFAMIPSDDEPAQDTTGIARAQEIITQAGHLDSMVVGLADLLVGLLEYRDPFFRGGTSQTRLLATAIAKELGMKEEEVQAIALGTVLRDLGQVPLKGLISKPGSELGEEGRRRVESHVDTALELLASVSLPPTVRDVIRHHHERWDGGGYPDGLVGEAIPLAARIVAVADSFAAMISARPHRLPRRVPAALEDIKAGAGRQYDPNVVNVLQRVLQGSDWRGLRFGLRHHVLIVDPDDSRAMVLATKLCSHGYLAEAAFDVDTARDRFKRSKLAAIIISADLAEDEIKTLVHEVRETVRVALLPVVVSDAGVSSRVSLLEGGVDVCLSRGASFEELKATVEAFLRREGKAAPITARQGDAAPWSGLQGDIEDFPLGWLLQVLNYDSRTAAVFLSGDGDDGVIYVQGGNPRHAQTRTGTGEDAFRAMLKWEKGSFTVDPDAKTEEQTIKVPLMNLLLSQAVQDDHAAFFGSVQA
ncbi:MAG: HD domain-containing phosphohydrolase [Gemmatimonadota bacterium]